MYAERLNVDYWSQRKGTDSCSVSYRFGDEKKPFYSIFQTNVSSRPTSSETIAIFFERLTPAQLKSNVSNILLKVNVKSNERTRKTVVVRLCFVHRCFMDYMYNNRDDSPSAGCCAYAFGMIAYSSAFFCRCFTVEELRSAGSCAGGVSGCSVHISISRNVLCWAANKEYMRYKKIGN